jgi:caa(3)-type oxidase subunit IV
MGEHETHGIMENIFDGLLGKDIYFWNFIILMVFTLFEVAAVFFTGIPLKAVWAILIGVGIVKGYGISAYFMHLKGDPRIYTRTALFPVVFVILMLWGIGLSNPEGVTGLPAWCTPLSEGYATNR